jgi:hypothetical protein
MSAGLPKMTFNACAFDVACTRRQESEAAAELRARQHRLVSGWREDALLAASRLPKHQPPHAVKEDRHG